MKRLALLLLTGALAAAPCAMADQAAATAVLQAGCAGDAQKFCSNVQNGGGRIIACLKQNYSQLTDQCKQAGAKAQQMMNGNGAGGNAAGAGGAPGNAAGAPAAAPAAAGGFSGDATPPAAPAANAPSPTKMKAAGKGTKGSYVLLKKVELTDPGMSGVSGPQPAYELMIPPTWKFQGTVSFGAARDGCFADLMAVNWHAASPDGSVEFDGIPSYSWQYSNSPQELKNLNDPAKRSLGPGGKPCPVAKPMKAVDYINQTLLPALKGATLVSVEQFPELNQMARQQLGLSSAGGGNVQTEAVRARFKTTMSGKPAEAWISMVVVTTAYQVGGGTFWNCQAMDTTALVALPGQLDANDKLYRVMATAVQPVAKWQAYADGMISRFNQQEEQKNAKIDQTIAQFQMKVVQTINATVALSEKGANTSAFTADQLVRGVQTFRNPATGKTVELSNQYDHAWSNGSDEYAMSDDPNFNPKSELSGNWEPLQVVHPAP